MTATVESRTEFAHAAARESIPGNPQVKAASPSTTDMANDSRLWRGSLIGAALGFVVLAVTITLVGTLGGLEPVSALGIGAFVGLWGGCGFGMMMGGVVAMQAIERRERRAAVIITRRS